MDEQETGEDRREGNSAPPGIPEDDAGWNVDWESLVAAAWAVRGFAYAPYSRFAVGAAVLGWDGRAFVGCNVENLSFGLTVCAERSAVAAAVAGGCGRLAAVVVVADTEEPISPCGACRQVLCEFGDPLLVTVGRNDRRFSARLTELLPRGRTGILDLG